MVTIEPVDSMVRNLESGKIQWKQDRAFGVQGWLSNDQLVITRRPADRDFESTLILNPFTQEEHEFFIEDYPNYKYYKSSGIGNYLFGHSNLMPDPTLTLMAYPEVNADGLFTTLWDLNTNRALAKVLGVIEDVYNDPLWSQAGNDFLIQAVGPTGGFEWYQVTREGYVRQLTQFNRFITEMGFADSSRSWDGRYLVFSLYYEYEGERGSKYIVLDLSLPNLDGFCIDNTMRSDVGVAQSPVWSPDSQYLIISDMITYNRGNLVLVDIKRRHAFHVTNDVEVRGWINNPESIR
jgi:hypothetical protein